MSYRGRGKLITKTKLTFANPNQFLIWLFKNINVMWKLISLVCLKNSEGLPACLVDIWNCTHRFSFIWTEYWDSQKLHLTKIVQAFIDFHPVWGFQKKKKKKKDPPHSMDLDKFCKAPVLLLKLVLQFSTEQYVNKSP